MTAPPVERPWALVTAAQQGDMEAFAELWGDYRETVFRFAYSRLNTDVALAQDITSETFVRALRRLGTVTPRENTDPGAWFITIARNLVIDYLRSGYVRLQFPVSDVHAFVDEGIGAGNVVERAVMLGGLRGELARAVAQLTPEQQQVVVLRFWRGLSVTETAGVLGIPEGAMKARHHRAMVRLRELLRGWGP